MSLGPLLVDIAGTALSAEDKEVLRHPLVGGVILFTRNYADLPQLMALVESIHALREPPLLVAVDQEGGRVQRFRRDFTSLPPARLFGRIYDQDPKEACRVAELCAWLMAAELRAVQVDLSFAPVVDLDYGVSAIIGDRALHPEPEPVAELGRAWLLGMRRAGMAACAKHFPGHGAVEGDSHLMLPVDSRALDTLRRRDLVPYQRLLRLELPAVMMAHVVYAQVDDLPASFSRRWIGDELRDKLRFEGAVFCDDLSMRGAEKAGDYLHRAEAALAAGCDMLPVCNSRPGVTAILDSLDHTVNPVSQWRLARLHGREGVGRAALQASAEWSRARHALERHYAAGDFKLEA
ncbi:MAG TPA: beta-N-acetylhexosaminidase [Gammaproteobacteria bacterium]|nr:beta-N-acetylhexosaminidase [Gammaproteobacteria bacterium]